MCIMGDAITLGFLAILQGWVFDKLAKYGIGWASKRARGWINTQLESKLKIPNEAEVMIQNLNETGANLWITIHVWNIMPLKLKIETLMGTIETEGYEVRIDWNRTVEKISHHKIQDLKIGENRWAFSVWVPLQVLKNRASKRWHLAFVSVFENKTAKTFSDVEFKIRDSDVKLIQQQPT